MQHYQKLSLFLASGLLFFSGCGDVSIPESIPENDMTQIGTENQLSEEEMLGLSSPSPSPLLSGSPIPGCEAVQLERDNLSEAITLAQEELKTCKAEKEQGSTGNATSATSQLKSLEPILANYIATGKKNEFKFDLCGGIGRVTQELWYSEFQKSLDTSGIMFKAMNRKLIPADLYSVCFSNEGKMAVFLGASNQSVSEFHLLKYNFSDKSVQEAYSLGGSCETCPNQFGKRIGPAIVLFNKSGARTVEYNYFYDMNVIQAK